MPGKSTKRNSWLVRLREDCGLTQMALAKILRVGTGVVGRLDDQLGSRKDLADISEGRKPSSDSDSERKNVSPISDSVVQRLLALLSLIESHEKYGKTASEMVEIIQAAAENKLGLRFNGEMRQGIMSDGTHHVISQGGLEGLLLAVAWEASGKRNVAPHGQGDN